MGGQSKLIPSLIKWGLERNWEDIALKDKGDWKKDVMDAAEKIHASKLNDECVSKNRNETKQKTKTKHLESIMDGPSYVRAPDPFIMKNQQMVYARALIMARYGMLQCVKNISNNYGGKLCSEYMVKDDENHRINDCKKWSGVNRYNNPTKIKFDDICQQ